MCEHSTLRKLSGNVCISFTELQTRTLRKRSRSSCFFGKKIVFRQNAYLQSKYLSGFGDCYFAERTFGIKAKPANADIIAAENFAERTFGIKAKLRFHVCLLFVGFCRKNFWNQGKASVVMARLTFLFCRKNFWNQGKAEALCSPSELKFCRKNFWNQGKADDTETLRAR